MKLDTFTIEGRTVSMPVEVRAARNWIATFSVDAGPVRRLIEPTGLEVAEPKPGRALVTLGFISYDDTDLGAYREFTFSIIVRRHDAGPAGARRRSAEVRRNRVGVYIHRLPVDDAFSMAAGRGIWGYPKTLMDFERSGDAAAPTWTLSEDGRPAVTMRWARRFIPLPRTKAPPTYTLLDGVLRLTPWESNSRGVRARPRGAELTLGEGPIAEELRSLGLPTRPVLSMSVADMRARFGSPQVLGTRVSGEKESEERAQKN
jgi:acetoacetate decarboxylase